MRGGGKKNIKRVNRAKDEGDLSVTRDVHYSLENVVIMLCDEVPLNWLWVCGVLANCCCWLSEVMRYCVNGWSVKWLRLKKKRRVFCRVYSSLYFTFFLCQVYLFSASHLLLCPFRLIFVYFPHSFVRIHLSFELLNVLLFFHLLNNLFSSALFFANLRTYISFLLPISSSLLV